MGLTILSPKIFSLFLLQPSKKLKPERNCYDTYKNFDTLKVVCKGCNRLDRPENKFEAYSN